MTEELPAPLVPPEVDLRGLDYMPLFGNHLFGSEFNAMATDEAWRAGVTLWWAAWNQQPAGSLPDNDTALCRLADLGRDVKGWKQIREVALRGFTLCNDGRLYHPFLCKQALIAWDKRVKERDRKAEYRAKKAAEKAGQSAVVPRDNPGTKDGTGTGTGEGQDADVRADGNGRDVTGRDVTSKAKTDGGESEGKGRSEPPEPLPALSETRSSFDQRMPDDWQPTEDTRQKIARVRPDLVPVLDTVAEKFRLYAQSTAGYGGLSRDWQASFRKWVLNERPHKPGSTGSKQSDLEARNRAVADAWQPPEIRDAVA